MQRNIETFIGCDAEYADARIVLFGAPFDSTTSYRPGARFGPSAARHESYGLETFSPYLFRDMSECAVFDAGDIELPMGSSVMALEAISEQTAQILSNGKVPFMVGGEHLVTLGAFRQAAARYPDIHIIHLDAHADLRQDYLGVELSHATVMRRCYDIVGEGRIHQYGIRSGEKTEFCFSRDGYTDMHPFNIQPLENMEQPITTAPVYLTIDLDVLDPSIFPGTGTPEAGGVTFAALQTAIYNICRLHNIVAVDVCELAPNLDASGVSTAVACKVIRELLLSLRV